MTTTHRDNLIHRSLLDSMSKCRLATPGSLLRSLRNTSRQDHILLNIRLVNVTDEIATIWRWTNTESGSATTYLHVHHQRTYHLLRLGRRQYHLQRMGIRYLRPVTVLATAQMVPAEMTSPDTSHEESESVTTRSGRNVRKPLRYND